MYNLRNIERCENCTHYTEDGECVMVMDNDRTMPKEGWCPMFEYVDGPENHYIPEGDD